MKKIFRSVFLFLLLAGTAVAESSSRICDRELAFDGVALGDTEATVFEKLGKPLRTTNTGEGRHLDYAGLVIWSGLYDPQDCGTQCRVDELFSTSPKRCTPSGVCPGMTLDAVKALHGEPIVADREARSFMEYASAESPCWLQLTVNNGIVVSARAACQP